MHAFNNLSGLFESNIAETPDKNTAAPLIASKFIAAGFIARTWLILAITNPQALMMQANSKPKTGEDILVASASNTKYANGSSRRIRLKAGQNTELKLELRKL